MLILVFETNYGVFNINLEGGGGGWIYFNKFYPIFVYGQDYENTPNSQYKYNKCNMVRKLNNTWYLSENPYGKNHGLISDLHSNLKSTKCEKDYNLISEVITHLPNPGMSEPNPIACDLRNLIPETTQDFVLNEENAT